MIVAAIRLLAASMLEGSLILDVRVSAGSIAGGDRWQQGQFRLDSHPLSRERLSRTLHSGEPLVAADATGETSMSHVEPFSWQWIRDDASHTDTFG